MNCSPRSYLACVVFGSHTGVSFVIRRSVIGTLHEDSAVWNGSRASVNPLNDHISDEELEPDRTSHQLRALEALNRAAAVRTDTGKRKGKAKAIERELPAAGRARGTHHVSLPEDERRPRPQCPIYRSYG